MARAPARVSPSHHLLIIPTTCVLPSPPSPLRQPPCPRATRPSRPSHRQPRSSHTTAPRTHRRPPWPGPWRRRRRRRTAAPRWRPRSAAPVVPCRARLPMSAPPAPHVRWAGGGRRRRAAGCLYYYCRSSCSCLGDGRGRSCLGDGRRSGAAHHLQRGDTCRGRPRSVGGEERIGRRGGADLRAVRRVRRGGARRHGGGGGAGAVWVWYGR